MRHFLFLGFVFTVLLSCTGTEENEQTTDNSAENTTTQTADSSVNEELDDALIQNEPTPFFLDDFPRNWLQVELGDEGKYYMQHYCDAEVASIRISPEKGEDWTLYTGWGQDGEILSLQNFMATSEDLDGIETVAGNFEVYREYDGALNEVSFIWTKDDMICEFIGLNFQSPLFVVESESDRVEHLEEDCEDFWE